MEAALAPWLHDLEKSNVMATHIQPKYDYSTWNASLYISIEFSMIGLEDV
jgi:hypothetical protein